MQSVRDSLKAAAHPQPAAEVELVPAVDSPDNLRPDQKELKPGESELKADESKSPSLPGAAGNPHREMLDRMMAAADQRTNLAAAEIDRLQGHLTTLQERLQDIQKQNLPPGEIQAQVEATQIRLEEAKADLARAHEAKSNLEHVAGAALEHGQELGEGVAQGQGQGHAEGHEAASPAANSVRSFLGIRKGGAPKAAPSIKHK